jgi:hypothetical protein
MSLTRQRLRGSWQPRRFVLEKRELRVKAGESFIIEARKADGFWIGERVPLERVANKRPISRRWRTISTL